ncbi:MAG: FtsX-like permease family protein [Proteobacteria bacterium]|nr:FtsX-like permease family protein [Pseudomonadota bacterium]
MTYFRLLGKNLIRKKLRLFLTIFSIFTAFLIFGVLKTFDSALNAGVELAGADRLITSSKVSLIQPLPYAHYTKIRTTAGVENVTHASWFGGYYQEPKNFLASFAVDAESYLDIYPEIYIPEDQSKNFLANRRGVLVGEALAQVYSWKVGDTLPLISSIWTNQDGSRTWEFQVEGIFTGKDEQIDTRAVIFHYDYFNEGRTGAKDTIGWLIIKTESPELNEAVSKAIDDQFANSPNETKTDTEAAFSKAFLEQFGNIGLIITSVVGAAFFTILLVAGNTMVLAVRERTNEIAVMKTLGFSNGRIFTLIVLEALLLVLLGGLPALGVSWFMVEALKSAVGGGLPPMALTPEILLQAIAYMLLLGFVTGGLPAFNAVRINVAAALGRKAI